MNTDTCFSPDILKRIARKAILSLTEVEVLEVIAILESEKGDSQYG